MNLYEGSGGVAVHENQIPTEWTIEEKFMPSRTKARRYYEPMLWSRILVVDLGKVE